jgi:flagellin-like protein
MKQSLRTTLGDRGVSPVIGVILMVAITVILAAVIGSFVLGIGGDVEATPQASLSFSAGNDQISHNGGDTLESGEYHVVIQGGSTYVPSSSLGPGGSIHVDTSTDTVSGTARVIHNGTGNVIAEGDL